MKKTVSVFVSVLLLAALLQSWAMKESHPATGGRSELNVATFNLRMDTEKDGVNAWPNRKEMVKGLIRFHDFDIFGTQEGFKHMLDGIAELDGYAYIGAGAMTARMRANIQLSSIRPVVSICWTRGISGFPKHRMFRARAGMLLAATVFVPGVSFAIRRVARCSIFQFPLRPSGEGSTPGILQTADRSYQADCRNGCDGLCDGRLQCRSDR